MCGQLAAHVALKERFGDTNRVRVSLALLDEAAKRFVPRGKNDVPSDLDGFEQAAVVRHEEKGAAI